MGHLHWLPEHPDFRIAIKAIPGDLSAIEQWHHLRWLAGHDLNFAQTIKLDNRLRSLLKGAPELIHQLPSIKLAILASATVDHLQPSICIAALRRGLIVETYVAPYGQYRQEILNPASQLHQFAPNAVLLSLDNTQLQHQLPLDASWDDIEAVAAAHLAEWSSYWQTLQTRLGAVVLQETFIPPSQRLFGHYDSNLPATPGTFARIVNDRLRRQAAHHRVLLLDVESLAATVGLDNWTDPALWHHAKQAVSPVHAPLYGEQVGRLLAALRGLSAKCLVVDLDNTLWGGVIGDDGLGGIELGSGTGPGEAFQSFQRYLKRLKERGIILAVCSKNNHEIALEPFNHHPEMVLKLEDFAVFVANWEDKAANLKTIAQHLNIGLDSLVFFDDNPAERAVVRQFLPVVAVPEVPEDPAYYIHCLSDGGYFEAVSFSGDDAQRAEQYRANAQRQELQSQAHDINSFLERLDMQLTLTPVDDISLQRATQLINRSNQFNLTTRRYTEAQVRQMVENPETYCWQARLTDIFGDNGLISVIIAQNTQLENQAGLYIDTWLMSCRVLGRQVEQAVTNWLVDQAQLQGKLFLLGEYVHTAKNDMVRNHYQRLGFQLLQEKHEQKASYSSLWKLDINSYQPTETFIQTKVLTKS
jgi:FkbH-like protein